MSRRKLYLTLPVLLAAPLIAWYAGGWATITVENLPEYIVAGQPTNMTFSIRQHGVELMSGLSPTVIAKSGKQEFQAAGVATNKKGYYTATLTAPATGEWDVTIKSGFGRSQVTLMPITAAASTKTRPVAIATADFGAHLFVAKGCLVCHTHAKVENSGAAPMGPDLTNRRFPREYLEEFLVNPGIKNGKMPNLNLKPGEVSSLIAFINTSQSVSVRD